MEDGQIKNQALRGEERKETSELRFSPSVQISRVSYPVDTGVTNNSANGKSFPFRVIGGTGIFLEMGEILLQ